MPPVRGLGEGGLGCRCTRSAYRGTSPIRKHPPLGPFSRPMPRALWWSSGVGVFICVRYPCRTQGVGCGVVIRA